MWSIPKHVSVELGACFIHSFFLSFIQSVSSLLCAVWRTGDSKGPPSGSVCCCLEDRLEGQASAHYLSTVRLHVPFYRAVSVPLGCPLWCCSEKRAGWQTPDMSIVSAVLGLSLQHGISQSCFVGLHWRLYWAKRF